MSENSKIEWTDHTFNPWEGCQKVGPGCDHCYAETRNARFAGGLAINWGPGAPRRRTSAANWRKPLAWNRTAGEFYLKHRRRQRVFCASLADVFDNAVDPAWREDLFALIRATPKLDWLLLTKRIGNVPGMISMVPGWLPENVWLGATVTSQAEADRDIPKLLEVPARVRFLSMEPLLGAVEISRWLGYCERLDKHGISRRTGGEHIACDRHCGLAWVIAGGESGPGARPMHPDWARSLRDQCAAAGVPFLFKQWGEHVAGELAPHPGYSNDCTSAWRLDQAGGRWNRPHEAGIPREQWEPVVFRKVGKTAAGRLLDGVQHDGFPASPMPRGEARP